MAALSSPSFPTQEAPTGPWRAKRQLLLSASSQPQALSPLASCTGRIWSGEKGFCVSAFGRLSASSCRNRRLLLLRSAAFKRTSAKQKSVINEPLEFEGEAIEGEEDEEYVVPELPGEERDFWEGPQFEILGFIVQYLWAFGIVIALGGCLIAVKLYNEGATDFKETQVYKESMEAQGFLESPSDSKVFDEVPSSKGAPSVKQDGAS